MRLSLPSPQGLAGFQAPASQPAAPQGQPDGAVDVRQLLRVFTTRLPLIIACTLLCIGAGVFYIVKTPKMYASHAVLEGSRRASTGLKLEDNGPVDKDTLEELHTFEQNLTNRTLLVNVARELKLDQDVRLFPKNQDAKPVTDAVLANTMGSLVSAGLRRGTRLVDLSAKFYDAETAREIVDKVIELYVAQGASMETAASKKTRSYLTAEADRLEAKLVESDKKLQKFKQDNAGAPLDGGYNLNMDQLKDMNAQLTAAKGLRLKLEAEIGKVESLEADDPMQVQQVAAIASVPEVAELQRLLGGKEMEFSVLKQRYGYKHPKYIQAEREVTDLRAGRNAVLKAAVDRMRTSYSNAMSAEMKLQAAIDEQETKALEIGKLTTPYMQLQNAVAADRELYESVSKRMKELAVTSAIALTDFRVSESPMTEADAVSPKKKQVLALAGAAGMMIGCGFAFLLQFFKPASQPSKASESKVLHGLPVLAQLPVSTEIDLADALGTASFNSAQQLNLFSHLRGALSRMRQDREPRSIAITSAESGAGKSYCAMHLAMAYAKDGLRTLLIETDLRQPVLADALLEGQGLPALGLADGLANGLAPTAYCHHTMVPGLYLIPAGYALQQTDGLLAKPSFQTLMMLAWNSFDRIILDTPTVQDMDHMLAPVRFAEAVCVVAREGHTSHADLAPCLQKLRFPGHAPTGLIVNGATSDALPSSTETETPFTTTAQPVAADNKSSRQNRGVLSELLGTRNVAAKLNPALQS